MQVPCFPAKPMPPPPVGPPPGKGDLSKTIKAAFTEVMEAVGLEVEDWGL